MVYFYIASSSEDRLAPEGRRGIEMVKSFLEPTADFLQMGIMFNSPQDERRETVIVQTLPKEEARSLGKFIPVS